MTILLELPFEVLSLICDRLCTADLLLTRLVCRTLRDVAGDVAQKSLPLCVTPRMHDHYRRVGDDFARELPLLCSFMHLVDDSPAPLLRLWEVIGKGAREVTCKQAFTGKLMDCCPNAYFCVPEPYYAFSLCDHPSRIVAVTGLMPEQMWNTAESMKSLTNLRHLDVFFEEPTVYAVPDLPLLETLCISNAIVRKEFKLKKLNRLEIYGQCTLTPAIMGVLEQLRTLVIRSVCIGEPWSDFPALKNLRKLSSNHDINLIDLTRIAPNVRVLECDVYHQFLSDTMRDLFVEKVPPLLEYAGELRRDLLHWLNLKQLRVLRLDIGGRETNLCKLADCLPLVEVVGVSQIAIQNISEIFGFITRNGMGARLRELSFDASLTPIFSCDAIQHQSLEWVGDLKTHAPLLEFLSITLEEEHDVDKHAHPCHFMGHPRLRKVCIPACFASWTGKRVINNPALDGRLPPLHLYACPAYMEGCFDGIETGDSDGDDS